MYYLYVQLKDYKSGLRASEVMGPIASGLGKDQMRLIGQYLSEQDWPGIDHQTGAAQKRIALTAISAGQCVACHLGGFEGNSRVPRVAGQHASYLTQTMLDFKTKVRNNPPAKECSRNNLPIWLALSPVFGVSTTVT